MPTKLIHDAETGETIELELTDEEIGERDARFAALSVLTWEEIRAQREELFEAVDTQWKIAYDNNNTTLLKKIKTYRNALRDVTSAESPEAVVWPEKP